MNIQLSSDYEIRLVAAAQVQKLSAWVSFHLESRGRTSGS